jgi:multidrug efflux pump subunit AcrB
MVLNKRSNFNLSLWAIEHSRLTLSFWLAVIVAGLLAFSSLKYSLFPEIRFPVAIIRAQTNLETVLDTETKLTIPIETGVKSLTGLTKTGSTTYAGQSILNLRFDTKTNIETATKNIEQTLLKLSLPPATTWQVIPFNLNESSAVSYALTSDSLSLIELTAIAKTEIIPQIDRLSGVSQVNLLGNDRAREEKSDLSLTNNTSLVRFNARSAIALQIIKNSDANTLEVVESVEKVIERLTPKLNNLTIDLAETQANFIREATNATIEALFGAIFLAIIIIFPFLKNWRATLIAAIAIPMSLLGTFIVMAIAGFNLETLTLLALALIVGIIVDDAIVEVENIMRYLELGYSPREAAKIATEEIGVTVAVTTLTIVAVFLPIALMGGTLGQFFRPFGLTISAAVLTSLLVARTLSPVLAVYWLKGKGDGEQKQFSPNSLTSHFPIPEGGIIGSYRKLLLWSLAHRKTVLGIAVASFIAGLALIPLIPQGFIPQIDRGEFNILYTAPLPKLAALIDNDRVSSLPDKNNTSSQFGWLKSIARSPETILLRKTIEIGEKIETAVLDNPAVESTYTVAGVRGEPNKGKIYVRLKGDRNATTDQIEDQIRQNLPQLNNVTVSIEDIQFVETGDDTPFKIALLGDNLTQLQQSAIALKTKTQQLSGLVDVRVSSEIGDVHKIAHLKGKRVVYLSANLATNKAIGDATKEVTEIAKTILPPEITVDLEGDSARSGKILREFAITLTLAVILMSIVIYLPFKRFLEPLVIVLSLPLSIVGAMLALLITQSDFGMISLIGLIFLLGLLDKNGILLLDYGNRLRQSGMSRTEAVLTTGIVRLRPIVMTTASTILGMLPIALGWGAGAELRQPMAVAIIGGLITSSLLSLIVIPVLYTLLDDRLSVKLKVKN